MVTARDGGKEEIIKIIRNVVVNATVNGPGTDGDNSGELEEESKSAVEINPFVSNIIMFKSCVFIVEYVCSITGAVIFTFYQGNLSICF
ncbi:Gametocyte surface protein [Trichinella spiralis]|uniref:Gametocyte surface protein n=1 Tax=Trichinella spiralis TaxID=6334 RepID=A0ABR3KG58_TRISP